MGCVGSGIMLLMSGLPEGPSFSLLRLAAVVPSATAVYVLAARVLRIEARSTNRRRLLAGYII
jgi:hypothetical protein